MNDKAQLLAMLRDEFNRWDALLNSLPEEQVTPRQLPGGLSIKDVVAHLWSWQQRSVARIQAALNGTQPVLSGWPENLRPDDEGDLEQINAWIHNTNLDKPWPRVYADWRAQFLRFLELSEAVPEADLVQIGKYTWLAEYPLSAVLEGSYEHHHEEHLGPLLDWLGEHENMKEA